MGAAARTFAQCRWRSRSCDRALTAPPRAGSLRAAIHMSLLDLLQGKWLGHPLHPALVHLPTGLWTSAAVFDLIGVCRGGGRAAFVASFACIAAGIVTALAAAPTGLADWWGIKRAKPAWKIG